MSPASNGPETKGVKVPSPPQRRGIIAQVPTPVAAPDNLSKPNSGLQDMNFKMSPEFHRAFKITASIRGMAMKDLLEASFRCWVEHYGDDQAKALLPPKE
jgi:hypothetical protein